MAGSGEPGREPEAARGGSVGGEQFDRAYWRRLVAHLAIDTGRTREEVLAFDADWLDDLMEAWDESPPLRWTVAAVATGLGIIKPKEKPSNDLGDLLNSFAQAGGTVAI